MKIVAFIISFLSAAPAVAEIKCSFVDADGYLPGGSITFFSNHAILESASGSEFIYGCEKGSCANQEWLSERTFPIHLIRLMAGQNTVILASVPSSSLLNPEISQRNVECIGR